MALVEKVTQIDDLMVYEIFRNPALFAEFLMNYDILPGDEPFELAWFQVEILCDFAEFVSVCAGRSVGKTVSLSLLIVWLLVFEVFPTYVVYTVPNKNHLEPVFTNLIRMFRTNTILKQYIEPRSGINSGEFSIKLLNISSLICRIAGQSGTGANVVGLHSPFVILDEAGYYPWGTWVELQPIVNTFTPGFRLMTSGVPTGLRENNVLYATDQVLSQYAKHRISAYDNPRFTEKDEIRAIEDNQGKDSDDFIHLVLGQHGKPVFSLFDRGTFEISDYPVYKLVFNGIEMLSNISEYVNKLSIFPGVPLKNAPVVLGIDLGYTEPTAIVILYLDTLGRLKFHGRIRLDKVSYPIQEKLIDFLDTKYNPILLGIDKGSAGIGVIQNLQESLTYIHKNYDKRLIPVDFSSMIVLGMDENGEEIKSKTKPYATSILQDYSNSHKLVYTSTDLEMVTELERMTYSKTPTGDIVYKTLTMKGGKRGEDHFTAALLCGVMAYYLNTEYILNKPRRKKLIGFSWLGAN